jgi:hypothetical protein
MGKLSLGSACTSFVVICTLFVPLVACHRCGLSEHDRVSVAPTAQTGAVPCCGGAVFQDVKLEGQTSDAEFSLANTNIPTQPGGVDAFLVPTSCQKLFDGAYPGAAPLCTILAGPAKPGGVSSRAKLSPGTYRVYLQGYSNVTDAVSYLVDVYVWDYRCRTPVQ